MTLVHETVKGRICPFFHMLRVTVLDRVPMDIINMPLVIHFIPHLVFPKTPLPEACFLALGSRGT